MHNCAGWKGLIRESCLALVLERGIYVYIQQKTEHERGRTMDISLSNTHTHIQESYKTHAQRVYHICGIKKRDVVCICVYYTWMGITMASHASEDCIRIYIPHPLNGVYTRVHACASHRLPRAACRERERDRNDNMCAVVDESLTHTHTHSPIARICVSYCCVCVCVCKTTLLRNWVARNWELSAYMYNFATSTDDDDERELKRKTRRGFPLSVMHACFAVLVCLLY